MVAYSKDEASDLVIRATAGYRVGSVIIGVLSMAFMSIPFSGAGLVGLGVEAAFTVPLFVLFVSYFFRFKVVVSGTGVSKTRLLRRARRVERGRIGKIVCARVMSAETSFETMFLVDGQGRLLLRVPVYLLPKTELDRLVQTLGVPSVRPGESPISPKNLHKLHPGLVPWYERHALLLALLTPMLILGSLVGGVAIYVSV